MATVLVTPAARALADVLWNAADGTHVVLGPGLYRGPLAIRNTVTMSARDGVGTVTIAGGRGATLSIEGSGKIMLRSLIIKGPTSGLGAIIRAYDATHLHAEDCVLTEGRGVGEGGGALDLQQGFASLHRCRLTNNTALQGGAIRAAAASALELINCVFADNRAEGLGGGAIFTNTSGRAQLRNCTFTGNRGEHGSAILAGRGGLGGSMDVRNCLFAKHQVGLSIAAHGAGRLHLAHSVLAKVADMVSESVDLGEAVIERSVPLRQDAPRYAAMFPTQLRGVGQAQLLQQNEVDVYGRPRSTTFVGAVA